MVNQDKDMIQAHQFPILDIMQYSK